MNLARLVSFVWVVIVVVSCEPQFEIVYVVPTVLNVRKGPSLKQSVVAKARRGQELEILAKQDPWVKIRMSNDTEGWVHGNYVGSPVDVRASLQKDIKRPKGTRVRKRRPQALKKQSNDLSIDGLLANLPGEIPTESLPPLEGFARVMGASEEGQVVVEFWGEEDKLMRAMIMVTVLDINDDELNRNADYALEFVKNSLSGLDRDRAWMLKRLKEISSRDEGSGELQAKGRTVSFEFLKALGVVRVTVVKDN
ncbi:MAG: SH3 domain-containing protein [Candidatus Latescibacterota bacterium]|nr:SH3 domain-containing protein [Candidatus Latescibacterota bacterium]